MEYSGALAASRRSLVDAARSKRHSIGAICESSPWLAKRMRAAIGATSLPILELGAGYGAVTRVLPETAVSVERDAVRFLSLKAAFPTRVILEGCALPVLAQLSQPTVIVSSIPSVNNPEFAGLYDSIARAHRAGIVTELVTYTYFPQNPFAGIFATSAVVSFEILNIPPAFVWRYAC